MKQIYTTLIDFGTPAFDETLRLRDDILRRPLGLVFEAEDIAQEYKDFHLACYDENSYLVGIMVLTPKEGKTIKMRQVAVKEELQRQGIGQKMVADCEGLCKEKGFNKIVLNARDTAIPFYEKLNYTKVGKPFIEVKIQHYKMEKTLA